MQQHEASTLLSLQNRIYQATRALTPSVSQQPTE
jgi:hypothetical protein